MKNGSSSWQSVSTVMKTLVAVVLVGLVCWQGIKEESRHKKVADYPFQATLANVELLPETEKTLPVATKATRKRRQLRYIIGDSPSDTTSGGRGKGGKGSKKDVDVEEDCPIELSVDVGPFVATPTVDDIQCTSSITSLDLIYTARNCDEGGFSCQDDTGDRPLFRCVDGVPNLRSIAIVVAYDDENTILFNGQVVIGRPFTLYNEGKPLDRVTVETYIADFGDPAQVYSFQANCDLFRFGCFTGFGGAHVDGWVEESQGTVSCPRADGTRTLEYTVDFSASNPEDNQIFDIVYAEYATISPDDAAVTPIEEFIGLQVDPKTSATYTVGGFNAPVTSTTDTMSKFTVLGLTVPERDLCAGALDYTIRGPSIEEVFENLCTDQL